MYIPKHYQGPTDKEAISFMQRFNFAVIITIIDEQPVATHLPFVIYERNDQLYISSHFAKANPQWKYICNQRNLLIFSEPHAYISPAHYEKKENVPTWNYVAIHAYGKAKLIESADEVVQLLEVSIDQFDPSYKAQWNTLSESYKKNMSKGIVGFEICVEELQSKEKLSQNKTASEQASIHSSLANSKSSNEKWVAEYMSKLKS